MVRTVELGDKHLGTLMRKLRRTHHLSQGDVAERMGIKPEKLSGFEHGAQLPKVTELNRFIDAVGLTQTESEELSQCTVDIILLSSRGRLERQQQSLQKTLELVCSKLRGKVGPKEIQEVVTAIVQGWSQAIYNRESPPAPSGISPFPPKKLPCKLCSVDVTVTKQGCCPNCGLYCSFWLRSTSDSENA